MLKIARSIRELDFMQMMAVYEQTNQVDAEQKYPRLSEYEQLAQVREDFYSYLLDFFREPGAFYGLWTVEGSYASALRVEKYLDGVILTGLETAPHLRRRGCAAALLEAVLTEVTKQGIPAVYSHVDKKNLASFSVHRKCGFEVISDRARLLDDTVTSDTCTLKRVLNTACTSQ